MRKPWRSRLTHDLHAFPARMHPGVVQGLLAAAKPSREVLDPFCGSGTTLVECATAGVASLGLDLNPLAVRLARVKTAQRSQAQIKQLAAQAARIARHVSAARRDRQTRRAPIEPREARFYAAHTLAELASLWDGIRRTQGFDREALTMAFSAILVKCSHQRGHTSDDTQPQRLPPGAPLRFWRHRVDGLCRGLAALNRSGRMKAANVEETDSLKRCADPALGQRFDLVLTSPPYGGLYDYATQHERSMRWLGLDDTHFAAGEFASRRGMRHAAPAAWRDGIAGLLRTLRPTLRDEASSVILCIGDAWLGDGRVDTLDVIHDTVSDADLRVSASLSQGMGRSGHRQEHLIWLRPAKSRGGRGDKAPVEKQHREPRSAKRQQT